jgi:DNA-binding NarL/FixJ family response regulator
MKPSAATRETGPGKFSPHRMLLLSSSPWLRLALRAAFAPEFTVHLCAETERRQLTTAIAASQPDLMVLDLIGRATPMLKLLKNLRAWRIRMPVLAFGVGDKGRMDRRILYTAANGFVGWHDSIEHVQQAIEELCGNKFPETQDRQKARSIGTAPVPGKQGPSPRALLSPRELQVFDLAGQGCTTLQISQALKLSLSTIETYRERIKVKLSIPDAAEFLRQAIRWSRIGFSDL